VATALLLAGGLSAVVVVLSPTGPLAGVGPPPWVHRFVAGEAERLWHRTATTPVPGEASREAPRGVPGEATDSTGSGS
jgi:hypothetical protein